MQQHYCRVCDTLLAVAIKQRLSSHSILLNLIYYALSVES